MSENADSLRIERRIAAPRDLVFRLWTKSEYLLRWFAPRACTLEIHAFDFRVGGELVTTIRGPDGSACKAVATYLEVVPNERIVYRIAARKSDAAAPEQSTVTVTFADERGGTLLRLHQTVPEELARRTGALPSWIEMLERLEEQTPGLGHGAGAAPSRLELFYHPLASYCHKVLIGLYESATPFVPKQVDLLDDASRASFFALWPVGKMPVLRDGNTGRVIPETSIILEYLDRHYPGPRPLLPDDPELALEARLWDRFFDLYVHAPMQRIVADRLRAEGERDTRAVGEARASLRTAYDVLEPRMRDREWAVGSAFGFADCAAAPALFYAAIVEPFDAERPALSAYFERLVTRPSYARVLAEARPYFELFPFREAVPRRFL